jgi:hypothetical protein
MMNDQIEKLLDSIDVNPKIRELAEQSGCSIDRLGFGEGHLEKFAELIVRECAEKAYAGIGPDSLDAYDRGWQNGRNSATQVIKEHFGVE